MRSEHKAMVGPLELMLAVYALFVAAAFVIDSPAEIASGLWKIMTCRGVLITDYMMIGGIGATLINASFVGIFSIAVFKRVKATPSGSTIMALWLNTGFAMFGKNVFNMLPLTFGVWLYSKVQKEPFANFTLTMLLSSTLSPVVSGFAFHQSIDRAIGIPIGLCLGIVAGFIFAPVSAFTVRLHGGYDLYNMGVSGGLISTFIVSGANAVGFTLENERFWSTGLNVPLAVILYLLAAGFMLLGLFPGGKFRLPGYRSIMKHTGRMVTDFYAQYGEGAYFNMGLLCALSTTLMLVIGADLNGPTLAGIFTIVGFGAFGKHLRNITPVMAGALICTMINHWEMTAPANTLAILFSSGLAPIAGQFGWAWGMLAGFLHVNTVTHIGFLNSGFNLYNNGYAAGFVALLLVPIMLAFEPERKTEDEKTSSGKMHANRE